MSDFHTTVLLNEAIDYLRVKKGEEYIDATLGGGGHSARIVELGGKVLSIDQDEEAISHVVHKFQKTNPKSQIHSKSQIQNSKQVQLEQNWILLKGNFAEIEKIAKETGFTNASGVLFDLGLSSHQLEDEKRGFAFDSDAELDMRMDKDLGVKANVLVNSLTRKELEKILRELGEEEEAWKIAREIERVRRVLPIRTCRQLSEICRRVKEETRLRRVRRGFGEAKHPATKVFQALRIQVNDELGSLERGLQGAFNILKKKGRIVVISFHSLEDGLVKKAFKNWQDATQGKIITRKVVRPTEEEIFANPRGRSAKMRCFQKT